MIASTFSPAFLSTTVWICIVLSALGAAMLLALLVWEWRKGRLW